jgi:heme oxygenase
MTPLFMQRLRDSIMPLHDEAERLGPLHKIPEKSVTLEEYKEILERLYGFVSVAEDVIQRKINDQCVGLDYESRKRIGHIEKDLLFLGSSKASIEQIPRCKDISHVETLPDALGCLYLFEGSRLGGLVLSKSLCEQFGFKDYRGYAYFGSNGSKVTFMWSSFRDFTETYVGKHGGGNEIILSAQKGFASLNKWLAGI